MTSTNWTTRKDEVHFVTLLKDLDHPELMID